MSSTVVHVLSSVLREMKKINRQLSSWVNEDVKQHNSRLKAYEKQTKLLEDMKKFMEKNDQNQ